MGKQSDSDTSVVVKNLAVYTVAFYILYYATAATLVAGFSIGWSELGSLPFEHVQFSPVIGTDKTEPYLPVAAFICQIICFLVWGTLLNLVIVQSTSKAWDYCATSWFLHFIITCVITGFPLNWIWWVTGVLSSVCAAVAGELSVYYFIDLRDIDLDN